MTPERVVTAGARASSLGRPVGGAALALALLLLPPHAAQAESAETDDPWYGTDKALHFTAGFGLAVGGYGLGTWAFDDRWAGIGLSSAIALGLGAAKEGLDAAGLGTPSWKDFLWTAVGAVLGVGVSVTFDAALRGPDNT